MAKPHPMAKTVLQHHPSSAGLTIKAYTPGQIRLNQGSYQHSLILSPEHIEPDWPVATADELTAEHLMPLLALEPELILIGTGPSHVLLPQALFEACYQKNIGVEVMSTEAACRTFNVLASDSRQVIAGLIL